MRDQHDGNALLFQAMDQAQHLLDLPDRDRSRWLVHQDELGVGQPRARDGDRLALTARHLLDEIVRPGLRAQFSKELQRTRRHRLVVKQGDWTEPALELAPEEDICRRRQIVGKRKVLVDDLDPHGACIDGSVEMHGLALEADVSMARPKIAGDDLHERRLARAVVAHQADHLSREDLHVDVMQRADRAELLADTDQFQDRFSRCSRRYHDGLPFHSMMCTIDPTSIRRTG